MSRVSPFTPIVSTLLVAAAVAAAQLGSGDTPMLPGGAWRVHDEDRPRPPVVTPGRTPGAPPSDAVVLFDGTSLDGWESVKGGPARWRLVDGAMEVNGTGSIRTRRRFGDCQLHVEWATPAEVESSSQGRGNSGVFLMGKYEVQVLDSFDNVTYADGQAAALYGQRPPAVNACRGPGEWQTYDVVFRRPRFTDDGAVETPARVTVLHNGVLVHDAQPFLGRTKNRSYPVYELHGDALPLQLQDHDDAVRFRNVWVRPLE